MACASRVLGRPFIQLLVAAAVARLLLLPLVHTWDGQSWVNTFAELSRPGPIVEAIRVPYETMRQLSLLTQADTRHSAFYEYWAYPPFMLLAYWPLAQLYVALGGQIQASFVAQPAFALPLVPLGLETLIRLPVVTADLATLCLLRALAVTMADLGRYAFNPLVLLIGVWTFDSVMVAFVLLALLLAERRHWTLAGVALGLGAATKFVPVVFIPALVLAILADGRPLAARLATLTKMLCAAFAAFGLLSWPVLDGVVYAVQFHAVRFSSGLTIVALAQTWFSFVPQDDWLPYASVQVGAVSLPLALLGATLVIAWRALPLSTAFLLLAIAFLVGSKLVNEPYALLPLALATVEVARRPAPSLRGCTTLMWVLAFLYAVLHSPVWAFPLSVLQQLKPSTVNLVVSWTSSYRVLLNDPWTSVPAAVLGTMFSVVIAITACVAWRTAVGNNSQSSG